MTKFGHLLHNLQRRHESGGHRNFEITIVSEPITLHGWVVCHSVQVFILYKNGRVLKYNEISTVTDLFAKKSAQRVAFFLLKSTYIPDIHEFNSLYHEYN